MPAGLTSWRLSPASGGCVSVFWLVCVVCPLVLSVAPLVWRVAGSLNGRTGLMLLFFFVVEDFSNKHVIFAVPKCMTAISRR